jgi:hypothetical protein
MNKKSYFGIIAIATAMLGAMVLSSCTHDDYYYSDEKAEKSVNEKYAIAFEKAFGKVGSNVDWGFSSKNFSTRAITRAVGDRVDYASYRGKNIEPTVTFPEDCNADMFTPDLENVPSYQGYLDSKSTQWNTVTEITGYAEVYIGNVQAIKINGGPTDTQHAKLYVKAGTYDFTNVSFYLGANVDLYLLEGATVTFDNSVASSVGFDIYIAPGAELIANGEGGLAADGGHIYNHGTITCTDFTATSVGGFLYNVGTLTTGTVNAASNTSRIVNDGTINSAEVIVDAGAVQNNYEWNVTGTTLVCSVNSGWVNNGQWKTYNYSYVDGSENVINNCYLWVTNDFEMNIGSTDGAFKIDTGGGVLTKNFYGGRCTTVPEKESISGPFKIVMGENAVFVVQETAQFESGRNEINDDKYFYGIYGPSEGGYAVFQAKNIVREASLANTWGAVTYRGHLYVSAETHFAQGNDGMAAHKFIFEQDGFSIDNNIYAAGFKSGKPNITIPKTTCSPGFKGGDPLYRVIAEDLSASEAGDFDFNDVVFDVVKAEGGVTTLKLICAGGTLPLRVRGANQAEGTEIHSLFGENEPNANGQYKMYNTGLSPKMPEAEFTVEGTYTTPEQIRNIIIEVYKNDKWMELTATTGKAACKILVDDTFVPVVERKNIADENQNFTNYVQGKFVDDFWWK